MKTTMIISAFVLCSSLLVAQETNKTATVRIKKIENINGVEKITDTTFTTNNPHAIELENGTINIMGDEHDGKMIKKVIINEGNGDRVITEDIELSKEIEAEIEQALKEAGVEGGNKKEKSVVIINHDTEKHGDKNEKQLKKIVITQKINITDVNQNEMKLLGKAGSETDGKLKIEKMSFYPNPSSGKFNLSFTLPNKGDAEVIIMNTEGKDVYKEKLSNFSGSYDKEIDISKNAKGIYFVKVEQGKSAQVKKIVLE